MLGHHLIHALLTMALVQLREMLEYSSFGNGDERVVQRHREAAHTVESGRLRHFLVGANQFEFDAFQGVGKAQRGMCNIFYSQLTVVFEVLYDGFLMVAIDVHIGVRGGMNEQITLVFVQGDDAHGLDIDVLFDAFIDVFALGDGLA